MISLALAVAPFHSFVTLNRFFLAGTSFEYCGDSSVVEAFLGACDTTYGSFLSSGKYAAESLSVEVVSGIRQNVEDGFKRERSFPKELLQAYRSPERFCLQSPDFGQCFFSHDLTDISIHIDMARWGTYSSREVSYLFMKPVHAALLLHQHRRRASIHHATGVLVDDHVILLAGPSDAGKSTAATLLDRAGFIILSDEFMVTRSLDGGYQAYGTPWTSDARTCTNSSAPLKAVFFLKHGLENRVASLSPSVALAQLLNASSVFRYAPDSMDELIAYCDGLMSAVPMNDLYFTPDNRFVEFMESL